MDVVELTKLFVEYKETNDRLESLEKQIQKEVLLLGDSQKIAGVKATFYKEGVELDYEGAVREKGVDEQFVEQYSTMTPKPRWKEMCEVLEISEEELLAKFSKPKESRVVVKV